VARVWVAMSGGVDSSTAAALLLEQGHDVTGVTMQIWPSSDEDGGCCSVNAVRDARRVCDLLGIPHYALNYRDLFEREVVTPFAEEYARGRTPNPCVVCNDRLKFDDLLSKVTAQGADFLATGHYARIVESGEGEPRLARALDPGKDQSYFLYRLTSAQLRRVLFPVGELHKRDVRAFAERFALSVAQKPDSQETCFAPAGDYERVVAARRSEAFEPGEIVDSEGTVLGHHEGVGHFTVGQRRGIGIASAEPLYVTRIDAPAHRVVVGPRCDLAVTHVEAGEVIWHPREREVHVTAAVRYRMPLVPAVARLDGARLNVEFADPLYGVAPGQAVVCYSGDVVLGGGTIDVTR